jgi:hypothetical protein
MHKFCLWNIFCLWLFLNLDKTSYFESEIIVNKIIVNKIFGLINKIEFGDFYNCILYFNFTN